VRSQLKSRHTSMTEQLTQPLPQTQAPFDSQPEVGSDPVVPSPGGAAGGQQQQEQPKAQEKKAAEPPAKQPRLQTRPESMAVADAQPGDGDLQVPKPPGGAGLAAVAEGTGEEVRCRLTLSCALPIALLESFHSLCVLPCPPLRRRPPLQPRPSVARPRPRPRRRRRRERSERLRRRRRRQRKPRLHLRRHPRRVSRPPLMWRLACCGVPCGAASSRGRSPPQWPLLPLRLSRPRLCLCLCRLLRHGWRAWLQAPSRRLPGRRLRFLRLWASSMWLQRCKAP
jgi:hypothetical protein